MLLLIPPMRRCNNLCNSALFVLWYYRCMDVIIDWNLGNMIYHGLITLWLCGFPIVEIGVVSVGIRAILDLRTKPSEMDDRIGRGQPFFRLYTDPAFTFMQGLSIYWPANTCSLKHADGNECRLAASRTATSGPCQAYLRPTWAQGFCTDPLPSSRHVRCPRRACQGHLHQEAS